MTTTRRARLLGAALLAALFTFAAAFGAQGPNTCLSGKNKCVSKKVQGLLKCEIKAIRGGAAPDPACIATARAKFDGNLLVPPSPAKGCFEKLEGKDPDGIDPPTSEDDCYTFDDTAAQEAEVDAFLSDLLAELDPDNVAIANKCVSGKIKCALKKTAGVMKCHEKAVKNGLPLDAACITKARAKFDGNLRVPPDPAKGCFARLEAKDETSAGPVVTEDDCSTFDDMATIEGKVDNFVLDSLCNLGVQLCDGTPTPTGATPTPTVTPTSTPGGPCPSLVELEVTAGTLATSDDGWTGLAHDEQLVSGATLTMAVTGCDNPTRPCGSCAFTGPVANTGANEIVNRRCTSNTRVACTSDAQCSGLCLGGSNDAAVCTTLSQCPGGTCTGGGTCDYFAASYLPVTVGGVSLCQDDRVNGVTGAAHVETGALASTATVQRRWWLFGPSIESPCPNCLGDAAPNDGVRGGTCTTGARSGLACDANGTHPNAHFGTTSLDCPPNTAATLAPPMTIEYASGMVTRTLDAASPNCRASGFTGAKCLCDTCDNGAGTPCSTNADCGPRCVGGSNANAACTLASACPGGACRGGTTCGGRRCFLGTNAGTPCSVASECPGGACQVQGLATQPNLCNDATCSPDGGNEGKCAGGPAVFLCGPNATMIGCTGQADCDAAGLRSCTLGINDGQVCHLRCVGGSTPGAVCTTDATCSGGTCTGASPDCPGGTCDIDTCSALGFRNCYPDNGMIGGSVSATGTTDTPVADEADPVVAALYCMPPTSASAFNTAFGFPGLGRQEVPVHLRFLP